MTDVATTYRHVVVTAGSKIGQPNHSQGCGSGLAKASITGRPNTSGCRQPSLMPGFFLLYILQVPKLLLPLLYFSEGCAHGPLNVSAV